MLKTLALTVLAASLVIATSCASRQVISTTDELSAVLEAIPVGQSRDLELLGQIRPYSGSNPKGKGLSEISVGSRILLIHSSAIHASPLTPFLNKTVAARVKISHFPLADSHPASQIAGTWITEISDIKLAQ